MSKNGEVTEYGRTAQALDEYVSRTHELAWISSDLQPLPGEGVIAVYEAAGVIKHVRTRYDPERGGWLEPALEGRKFYWVYDPPL
ncbi:MAG: hypothetical protein ACRD2T_02480 [Thermoanaerobaculia bacterium]